MSVKQVSNLQVREKEKEWNLELYSKQWNRTWTVCDLLDEQYLTWALLTVRQESKIINEFITRRVVTAPVGQLQVI